MKLITTDTWDCVCAAFAMVMDTTVFELKERLCHSGKELVTEDVPPPEGWRSYHPEEFVDILLQAGYSATMTSMSPMMIHGPKLINHAAFMGQERFFTNLLYGNGVVFGQLGKNGRGHAMAWDRETMKLYDPRGRIISWDEAGDFKPLQFFLIRRMSDGV